MSQLFPVKNLVSVFSPDFMANQPINYLDISLENTVYRENQSSTEVITVHSLGKHECLDQNCVVDVEIFHRTGQTVDLLLVLEEKSG